MNKSTLKQRCTEGRISIQEFIDFCAFKPAMNTSFLEVGDFLVATNPVRPKLDLVRVTDIDYIERGDFRAADGTTGPISENIFINFGKRGDYIIMEGDRPYAGPGAISYAVKMVRALSKIICHN